MKVILKTGEEYLSISYGCNRLLIVTDLYQVVETNYLIQLLKSNIKFEDEFPDIEVVLK